jgi:hypothetical protein
MGVQDRSEPLLELWSSHFLMQSMCPTQVFRVRNGDHDASPRQASRIGRNLLDLSEVE